VVGDVAPRVGRPAGICRRVGTHTDVALPIAFLLGAFPTRSISTIARRLARRQLNLGADTEEKAESELEALQGVDTRIAERFADEGITTIVPLAYSDPVELTTRCASFSFSFVVDCASQARLRGCISATTWPSCASARCAARRRSRASSPNWATSG